MAEPMSLDEGTPALDGEVEGVDEQELRSRPDASDLGAPGNPLLYPAGRDDRLADASPAELARHAENGPGTRAMGYSVSSLPDRNRPLGTADVHALASMAQGSALQPGRLGSIAGASEEICTVCGSTNGPWRRGPLGLRTLCNSCGHIAGSSRDAHSCEEAIELLDTLRLARIGRVKRRHDPAGTAEILQRLERLSDRTLALVQRKFALPAAGAQRAAADHRALEQYPAFPTAPCPYALPPAATAASTPPRRARYPLTAGPSTGMTPSLGTLDLYAEPALRRTSESSFPAVSLSASSSPAGGQDVSFGPRQSSVHPATSAWPQRLPEQQRSLRDSDVAGVPGTSSADRQHLDLFAAQRARTASRTSRELPPLPPLPPLGGLTRLNPQRTSPPSYALDSYRQTSPATYPGRRSPPARLGANPYRTGQPITEGIPLRLRSQSIAHMRVSPFTEHAGSTSAAMQGVPPLSSASDDYFARRSPLPPSRFYP